MRIRLLFSKRGPFCFIRHVELPQIFARAAKRAGLNIQRTEGFSPHPRISLGPALPVGVVACAEPVEIWFCRWEDSFLSLLNQVLPDGLTFSVAEPVDGRALNKMCNAGEYLVRFERLEAVKQLKALLSVGENPWGVLLLRWSWDGRFLKCVLADPAQRGPGAMVKDLVSAGVVTGWPDLRLARLAVGSWDSSRALVIPLVGDEKLL